jgi:SAM-dependent methyltransferase
MTRPDAQPSAVERLHSVAGSCRPELEALKPWPYSDDVLVGAVTDSLLKQGHTVFQMFMLDPDERTHSLMVLERIFMPIDGRVLSLGCGVGGMERYWVEAMPNIEVTLVNHAMPQLARRVCPGRLVLADMRDIDCEATVPVGSFDVVVMAYSLHHCEKTLEMIDTARSMLRPGGTLLVLDVVDGSDAYHAAVDYRTPAGFTLACGGLVRADHGLTWHPMPASVVGQHVRSLLDAGAARPGMWLGTA